MKRYFLFIALLLLISKLNAQQKITQSYTTKGINNVLINLKYAKNIELKSWNKKELVVQAIVNMNNNKDNHFFSLKNKKSNGKFFINSDYKNFFKFNNKNVIITNKKQNCKHNYNSIIVTYTVFVPEKINLEIKSISGNVEVENYNGKLDLNLTSGNITIKKITKEMNLKTISGDIDVYVSDAYLKAETISGSIYSNLDITFSNKNKLKLFKTKIIGKVNKGNLSLNLKTISGDIFLRKI